MKKTPRTVRFSTDERMFLDMSTKYRNQNKIHTVETELAFFKKLEVDEAELFRVILSHYPLGRVFIQKLNSFLTVEKESTPQINKNLDGLFALYLAYEKNGKFTVKQNKEIKELINLTIQDFRVLDASRQWVRFICQQVKTFELEKDYINWGEKVLQLSTEIQKNKNQYLESHIGLICRFINKKQRSQNMELDIPKIDLQQEACFGLMKAIDRFDYKKGFRFSTYATHWVRHSVVRAIDDKGKMVRMPVHIRDKTSRVKRLQEESQVKYGTYLSIPELCEATGFTYSNMCDILSPAKIFSMDSPVYDTGDDAINDWYDLRADTTGEEIVNSLHDKDVNDKLSQALSVLNDRELDVIKSRFGFSTDYKNDEIEHLQAVGNKMNLCRERVRQIEKVALLKMKNYLRKEHEIFHSDDVMA